MKKLITYLMCTLLLSLTIVLAVTTYDTYASSDAKGTSNVELTPKLDKKVGKYGYVDKKGKWVIEPQFIDAQAFSEGLAVVRYFIETPDEPYTGYIDSKGKPAFKDRFYGSYGFRKGYAVVLDKNQKVNIIDKKGKILLKTGYYYYNANPQISGILAEICEVPTYRGDLKQKVGYVTDSLKLVKPMFDGSVSYYSDNESKERFLHAAYAEVDSDNRVIKLNRYLINTKMEPVKLPSDHIISIKEGMILLLCDKYYAFVNMKGEIFNEVYVAKTGKKHKFVRAENFSEGRAVVQVDDVLTDVYGKKIRAYGYINKDGKAFKEPQYVMANSFSGGVAAVQPYPSYYQAMGILKLDGTYLMPPAIRTQAKISEKYERYFTKSLYSQGEYDYVISEVKKIVSQVTASNMSDYEKVVALQKYVMDHTFYGGNMEYDPTPRGLLYCYEAIGILKDGEGVCDAYTKLMGLLLTEVGIENIYVIGKVTPTAIKNGEENHSWLLVKLNGNYYHLDPTFNDNDRDLNYLLVSDNYMKSLTGVLKREWKYNDYPAAPNGYFNDKPQKK